MRISTADEEEKKGVQEILFENAEL